MASVIEERFPFSQKQALRIMYGALSGCELHPQIVFTEIVSTQDYLPSEQSSSGCIYFVCLHRGFFWFILVYSRIPQRVKWAGKWMWASVVYSGEMRPIYTVYSLSYVFPAIFLSWLFLLLLSCMFNQNWDKKSTELDSREQDIHAENIILQIM